MHTPHSTLGDQAIQLGFYIGLLHEQGLAAVRSYSTAETGRQDPKSCVTAATKSPTGPKTASSSTTSGPSGAKTASQTPMMLTSTEPQDAIEATFPPTTNLNSGALNNRAVCPVLLLVVLTLLVMAAVL